MIFNISKWFMISALLFLHYALNVSGLFCYVCVYNSDTGRESHCGSGTPLPCNTPQHAQDADRLIDRAILPDPDELTIRANTSDPAIIDSQSRPNGATVNGYMCVERIDKSSDDDIFAVRACASKSQVEILKKGCSQSKLRTTCTFCDDDRGVGKACNGVNNHFDARWSGKWVWTISALLALYRSQ